MPLQERVQRLIDVGDPPLSVSSRTKRAISNVKFSAMEHIPDTLEPLR